MMTTPSSSRPMSPWSEITLVAQRELRTQLLKKSSIISEIVLLVIAVVGIVVYGYFSSGDTEPYRLGVIGVQSQSTDHLRPALENLTSSQDASVQVIDLGERDPAQAVSDSEPQSTRVDMALDLRESPSRIIVSEHADTAIVAGITQILQQQAVAERITALGGDPQVVSDAMTAATPTMTVVNPPQDDHSVSAANYALLAIANVLLLFVIMGGGQWIAMGVVEEKSSRIVEILLACVRPSCLLAGKIVGTGVAVVASYGLIIIVAGLTARWAGVLPSLDIDLNAFALMVVLWMIVGFFTFAVLFAAAGSLVSRQEDVGNVTMPLIGMTMVPYMLSFFLPSAQAHSLLWTVLSYLPPFSAFLMPARMALGVSSWVEQGIALVIAVAVLPLLIALGSRIYTRAITRMGARVPLCQVLGRHAQS